MLHMLTVLLLAPIFNKKCLISKISPQHHSYRRRRVNNNEASPHCLQKSPRPELKQLRNSTKQGFHCGISGVLLISQHTGSSQMTLVPSIHLSVSEKLMTFKSKYDLRPTASSGLINTGNAKSMMDCFFQEALGKKIQLLALTSPLLWNTVNFEWIQQFRLSVHLFSRGN